MGFIHSGIAHLEVLCWELVSGLLSAVMPSRASVYAWILILESLLHSSVLDVKIFPNLKTCLCVWPRYTSNASWCVPELAFQHLPSHLSQHHLQTSPMFLQTFFARCLHQLPTIFQDGPRFPLSGEIWATYFLTMGLCMRSFFFFFFASATAVYQASAHWLSCVALQRLPEALKISWTVVWLAIMPLVLAVQSEPQSLSSGAHVRGGGLCLWLERQVMYL